MALVPGFNGQVPGKQRSNSRGAWGRGGAPTTGCRCQLSLAGRRPTSCSVLPSLSCPLYSSFWLLGGMPAPVGTPAAALLVPNTRQARPGWAHMPGHRPPPTHTPPVRSSISRLRSPTVESSGRSTVTLSLPNCTLSWMHSCPSSGRLGLCGTSGVPAGPWGSTLGDCRGSAASGCAAGSIAPWLRRADLITALQCSYLKVAGRGLFK